MLDEWEVYSYAIILLSPWGWWNLQPGALSFNFLYPNKKHLKWKLNPPLHAFSLLFCNIGQGEEIWCVCRSHVYLWKYVSQSSSFKVGLLGPFYFAILDRFKRLDVYVWVWCTCIRLKRWPHLWNHMWMLRYGHYKHMSPRQLTYIAGNHVLCN